MLGPILHNFSLTKPAESLEPPGIRAGYPDPAPSTQRVHIYYHYGIGSQKTMLTVSLGLIPQWQCIWTLWVKRTCNTPILPTASGAPCFNGAKEGSI